MQVGKFGQCRDTVLPMNLDKGNYIAIIQAEWKHDQNYDISFKYSGYFPHRTFVRERFREKPTFLKDSLVNKAQSLGK